MGAVSFPHLFSSGWLGSKGGGLAPEPLGVQEESNGLDFGFLSRSPSPGCTVVALVPPAFPTPLLLAQLAGELGSFPGILNVVCGPASLGLVLASQPGVQKVAYCGAVEVSQGMGMGWTWLRAKGLPPQLKPMGLP